MFLNHLEKIVKGTQTEVLWDEIGFDIFQIAEIQFCEF